MRGITFAKVLKKLFHFSFKPILGRCKEEWLVTEAEGAIVGVDEEEGEGEDAVSLATQPSS